jgi:hypothetical protein
MGDGSVSGAMNDDSGNRWPLDLRIFGAVCLVWAALLLLRAFSGAQPGSSEPFQDVILGVKLYGNPARLAMALQALMFAAFSIGILARRRWGLVLARIYWVYVGLSQLLFMAIYFHDDSQRGHVRNAEVLLPAMLLILFYIWYRTGSLLNKARSK